MIYDYDLRLWSTIMIYDYDLQLWYTIMIYDYDPQLWSTIIVGLNHLFEECTLHVGSDRSWRGAPRRDRIKTTARL